MIDRIHGGDCLKRGIADFSVNINPLGLPEGLCGIISNSTDIILRYPDPLSGRLKKKISILHNIEQENVTIGNGSIELIYLIPRALKIKKALIITPSFSEYEFALRANGSTPVFFSTSKENGFKIDCVGLAKRLAHCDGLFLCNPNNPTGSMLHSDDVLYLSRFCKKQKKLLILDEAFIEFTGEPKEASVISEAVKSEFLIIVRSLTKFFAIPGLRLGYAVGHKKTIGKVSRLQYPWNVNGLAQLAGEKALMDKKYMDRTRLFVAEERRYLTKGLGNIKGLKVYPSSANFVLCELRKTPVRDSGELTQRLLRKGIYIRACGNFRGLDNKFFRVAVRKRDDNERLINCVKKAVR